MAAKYLSIPVTNEQYQLVALEGLLIAEQESTTTVKLSYTSGAALTITHADAGAGSEVPRDEIEAGVIEALRSTRPGPVYQLDNLTYAVSAIDASVASPTQARTVVETITADRTLTAGDNGKEFNVATDALTITLPAVTAALVGTTYTVRNTGADGNNIITISPAAADAIKGSIANSAADSVSGGVDDKDIINTKATANNGDFITLVAADLTGWYITGGVGIWASEP